ncbi:gp53-like domain-containing protein [Burkholderia ubonensis]|uniref:gp53-like domain-containing protein n=1 Tax=Burkholderia ubonensis TaxID=101571 RepID=UPI002ABE3D4A|nr:hypothetical protein [Burkholderia ubonensis]
MTDLVESSTWTPGIRQFETSDPVEGGPDGIDNVPLRQLANRTRFLKDVQDAQAGGLEMKAPLASPAFTGSPQAPVPPQFDNTTKIATTSFVQQAAGNFQTRKYVNGSAALAISDTGSWIEAGGAGPSTVTLPAPATSNLTFTITNVTSNGAQVTISTPSASIYNQGLSAGTFALDVGATVELVSDASNWTVIGHYTRCPIAQTPAQFDNSTKLATTAFVQRALGGLSGVQIVNASTVLSASSANQLILLGGSSSLTLTLPPINSVPAGTVIEVQNIQPPNCTITATGTDSIQSGSGTFSSYTSVGPGWSGRFVSGTVSGSNIWQAVGGSLPLRDTGGPFGSSLAANGYQKLPSGLIIQWGSVPNIPAGGNVTVNYPISFPNGLLSISAIAGATSTGSAAINGLMAGASSNPKALFVAWNASSNLTTQMGAYISLGY